MKTTTFMLLLSGATGALLGLLLCLFFQLATMTTVAVMLLLGAGAIALALILNEVLDT